MAPEVCRITLVSSDESAMNSARTPSSVNYVPDVANGVWFALVLIATSSATGSAVLRYRLYEIDLIINRTLAYGVLTGTLALVCFGAWRVRKLSSALSQAKKSSSPNLPL